MKTLLSLTLISSLFFVFSCKPKDSEPTPVDPSLAKALVYDFDYTFKPKGGAAVQEIGGKRFEELYNNSTDAVIVYVKKPWADVDAVQELWPLPAQIDSTEFKFIVREALPINSDIFLYAVKNSTRPENDLYNFPGKEYAFGTKDSTMTFRIVILKGQNATPQSSNRAASLYSNDYNEIEKNFTIQFIK